MTRHLLPAAAALTAIVVLMPQLGGTVNVPSLSAPVVDEVGLLDAGARNSISQTLSAYQAKSGNQLQVLIIDTLDGEPIEDFSIRVAEKWKLGSAERDNGVLLLIVNSDRRWRIEVGGGLEGELPDALASRMGRNILAPAFRKGRHAEGIAGTLQAVAAALGDELQFSGVRAAQPRRSKRTGRGVGFFLIVLIAMIVFGGRGRGGGLLTGLFLGSLLGRGFRGGRGGGFGSGGGGWGGGGGGFSGGGASGGW